MIAGTFFGFVGSFFWFDSRSLVGPVIPKTLKMGVVSSCMVLTMKEGPRNITGRPGVSIM